MGFRKRLSGAVSPGFKSLVMKKASLPDDYLNQYAAGALWTLKAGNLETSGRWSLFRLTRKKSISLPRWHPSPPTLIHQLEKTLIICVINNKAEATDADKKIMRKPSLC